MAHISSWLVTFLFLQNLAHGFYILHFNSWLDPSLFFRLSNISKCLQDAICKRYKRCKVQEATDVGDAQENHIIDHHVDGYEYGCPERHEKQKVSAVLALWVDLFLIHLPLLAHFKRDQEEADDLDS